tara:strand:+ start:5775 stop:7436 length:1662 start_codon:yes stop_codon:yes gene_type:complete
MACIPVRPGQSRDALQEAREKLVVERDRLNRKIKSNALTSANFSTPQSVGVGVSSQPVRLIDFPVYWQVLTNTSTFIVGGSTEPYLTSDANEVTFTFYELGKLYTLEKSEEGTTSPFKLANPFFNANFQTHKIVETTEVDENLLNTEMNFIPEEELVSYLFVPTAIDTQTVNGRKINFSYFLEFTGNKEFTLFVYVVGAYQGITPLPNFSYGFLYEVPPEQLGLTESVPATPSTPASFVSDYEINPLKPYGSYWRDVRPPGYPKNGPPASTKSSGEAVLRQAISELNTLPIQGLPNSYRTTLTQGFTWLANQQNLRQFTECLRKLAFLESGIILYNPITKFDIRDPEPPGVKDNLNLPDEGPFPRGSKRTFVNSPKRPVGKKYAADCGIFQYTAGTFRGLMSNYASVFNIDSANIPTLFVWDTETKVQVYLMAIDILRQVFVPCINAGVPPLYRGILTYTHNAMRGNTSSFISLAAAKIATLGANPSELSVHLACKSVYDSKEWIDTSVPFQVRFWNNCSYKMAHSPYGLPRQFPEIFLNNPAVFPNTPSKIR